MRIDLTKIQVAAVVAMLRDVADGDDDQLLLDTLEGETNLFELSRRLLEEIETDEGVKAALAEQMADRQARKLRAEDRIKSHREAIMALLQSAGLDKLTLPEATLSVRDVPPKPIVTDEAAVPEAFCRIKRTPDITAIRAELEAGRVVSGVSMDNGGQSLTVRRK